MSCKYKYINDIPFENGMIVIMNNRAEYIAHIGKRGGIAFHRKNHSVYLSNFTPDGYMKFAGGNRLNNTVRIDKVYDIDRNLIYLCPYLPTVFDSDIYDILPQAFENLKSGYVIETCLGVKYLVRGSETEKILLDRLDESPTIRLRDVSVMGYLHPVNIKSVIVTDRVNKIYGSPVDERYKYSTDVSCRPVIYSLKGDLRINSEN